MTSGPAVGEMDLAFAPRLLNGAVCGEEKSRPATKPFNMKRVEVTQSAGAVDYQGASDGGLLFSRNAFDDITLNQERVLGEIIVVEQRNPTGSALPNLCHRPHGRQARRLPSSSVSPPGVGL